MRFRERNDNDDSYDWTLERSKSSPTCSVPVNYVDSTLQFGTACPKTRYESISDVVTPNFHALQNEGKIINNPYEQISIVTTDEIARYTYRFGYKVLTHCGPDEWLVWDELNWGIRPSSTTMGGSPGCLLSAPICNQQSLIDAALASAWSRVGLDSVQAYVMLGEAHKTVASVCSIFARFIKILKKIKKLDGHGLLMELTAKQLADRYMELRYALRPLLYDMNGTIAAFKTEAKTLHDRLTFRASKHCTDRDYNIATLTKQVYNNACGTWYKYAVFEQETSRTVDVRAGVLTQLETTSELPVWGLANPIEAAWELVPFSFIVDWFVNIGDTLSAWVPDYGLKALSSWYTVTDTVYQMARYSNTWGTMPEGNDDNVPLYHDYSWDNVFHCILTTTKTRVPDPSRYVMPSISLKLNIFKLTDLLIIAKKILR